MTFNYSYASFDNDGTVDQATLASTYSNALKGYLQTDEGADYVAFLSHEVNGLSIEEAQTLKAEIQAGHFALTGLFGAAQSASGPVDGAAIADPLPALTISLGEISYTIDLASMLGTLATESWTIAGRQSITTHTREFYSASATPEGYSLDWAAMENQAPTADPIVWEVTEHDEHASPNAGETLESINLLSAAHANDPEGDALSVVAGSAKLANGDGTYSDLPDYLSLDYATGTLSINTNSAQFDALYLNVALNLDVVYQITDGTHTIDNSVALTITGTADQFSDAQSITVSKIGDDAYSETGAYHLLGFDWSNAQVDVTGHGDYDFKNESFTVSGDVTASYTGLNQGGQGGTGNYENSFINVNPGQSLNTAGLGDGYFNYTVAFVGPVDGQTLADPDASTVGIHLTYDYWM